MTQLVWHSHSMSLVAQLLNLYGWLQRWTLFPFYDLAESPFVPRWFCRTGEKVHEVAGGIFMDASVGETHLCSGSATRERAWHNYKIKIYSERVGKLFLLFEFNLWCVLWNEKDNIRLILFHCRFIFAASTTSSSFKWCRSLPCQTYGVGGADIMYILSLRILLFPLPLSRYCAVRWQSSVMEVGIPAKVWTSEFDINWNIKFSCSRVMAWPPMYGLGKCWEELEGTVDKICM